MAEPAVLFDGVWKKFRRGERHDSLKDLIPATFRRLTGRRQIAPELEAKEFWAVHDVSFEVRPGEALGIIGPNGAGKSTILKLLTRILRPTRGTCQVRGRAGALIEVAAGFHPDLTGRENVFLQGAIMGMTRVEILRKFDEIVAFAGVSEFIDTPVKRYSSGMNARLGFAIAAHLDPDVLLIDEVLSVGDAAFQDRCIARMKELIGKGTPVVFISHNLPSVLELCTRTIVVDHGTVKYEGTPAEAIQEYQRLPWHQRTAAQTKTDGVRITSVDLVDQAGEAAGVFQTDGAMSIRIGYHAPQPVANASFAIDIHRGDGIYCAGFNTMIDRRSVGTLNGTGRVDLVFPKLNLLPGCYLLSVGIIDTAGGGNLDLQLRAFPFSVASDRRDLGVMYLPHEWHLEGTGTPSRERRPAPARAEDAALTPVERAS